MWIPSIAFGVGGCLFFVLLNIPNYSPLLFLVLYPLFYWLGENYVSPDLDLLSISGQDGRLLGIGRKNFFVGLFGLLFAMYSMVYSWIMQFCGGHRNLWSHSLVLSTIGRMLFFNFPIAIVLALISLYWGWSDWCYNLYTDVWLVSFLLAQFLAWSFSDAIHLVLDSNFAKGTLYTPGDKRKR